MKRALLLVAVLTMIVPMAARAADKEISNEVLVDFSSENRTRPTQDISDVFRATMAFKPMNVVARQNRNSITVTADVNSAVRVVVIEASNCKSFENSKIRYCRNFFYKAPVLVTRKAQIKSGASSASLRITQAGEKLYSRSVYHPNDENGFIDATQAVVDAVRKKISFRRPFQIPNCRSRYVRMTYIYTSAIDGKRNVRSESVVVRTR